MLRATSCNNRVTNLTFQFFDDYQPKSIITVSLLDKKINRKTPFTLDYYGKEVGEGFLMGYGLDYNEKYRNLPFIGVLKEEIYSE